MNFLKSNISIILRFIILVFLWHSVREEPGVIFYLGCCFCCLMRVISRNIIWQFQFSYSYSHFVFTFFVHFHRYSSFVAQQYYKTTAVIPNIRMIVSLFFSLFRFLFLLFSFSRFKCFRFAESHLLHCICRLLFIRSSWHFISLFIICFLWLELWMLMTHDYYGHRWWWDKNQNQMNGLTDEEKRNNITLQIYFIHKKIQR